MLFNHQFKVLTVCLVFMLLTLTAACGSAAEPTLAPTPEPTPESGTSHEEEGKELFVDKGCAACHGQEGEGSSIAPALAGHTGEQVRRQVRNSIGSMPKFGTDQISDKELEELVEFITGLTGNGHQEPLDMAPEDLVTMHHWMAILALKVDQLPEAKHHVEHIIELVEEEDHLHRMEEVLEDLNASNLHDAEHTIEDMLAGTAEPELSHSELHLQMILSALSVRDEEDARHHLQHFMEEAMPDRKEMGQEVMGHLDMGEIHEAKELVKRMIEGMPHQHHHH